MLNSMSLHWCAILFHVAHLPVRASSLRYYQRITTQKKRHINAEEEAYKCVDVRPDLALPQLTKSVAGLVPGVMVPAA